MLSNSDLIEKIQKFQSNPKMHSFTCGICSEELVGKEVEGVVMLACEQCNYTQKLYHNLIEAILFFAK
jgi:hypothetical protein